MHTITSFGTFPLPSVSAETPMFQVFYENPNYNPALPFDAKTNNPTLCYYITLADFAVQKPAAYAGYLALLQGLQEIEPPV